MQVKKKTEAVFLRCSMKGCSENCRKTYQKAPTTKPFVSKAESCWSAALNLFFYKQLLCKQLAFRWQMAKQLSGLNSLSLSNTKNYRLKRKLEFSLKRKITIKPTIHQNSTVSKALLRKF